MEKKYIGKRVIIRAAQAGVFYGTLEAVEGTTVEMKDCRRIWYWEGAATISEIAKHGIKAGCEEACKITVAVDSILIYNICEINPCSEDCVKSIDSIKEWRA